MSHSGAARTAVGRVGQIDLEYRAISSTSARLTARPPQVPSTRGSSIRKWARTSPSTTYGEKSTSRYASIRAFQASRLKVPSRFR